METKRYIFGIPAERKDGTKRSSETTRNPTDTTKTQQVERPAQGFNGPTPPNRMVQWARGTNQHGS